MDYHPKLKKGCPQLPVPNKELSTKYFAARSLGHRQGQNPEQASIEILVWKTSTLDKILTRIGNHRKKRKEISSPSGLKKEKNYALRKGKALYSNQRKWQA